jgi:hypothetical protein
MGAAWHRLDFVWRLTAIWIGAMWLTVVLGFVALKLAPTTTHLTWVVGPWVNLTVAVACGAALAWYRRCGPLALVAFLGSAAVSLSFDLLSFTGQSVPVTSSIGQFVVFDVLSTFVGFLGMIALFVLGAPLGLLDAERSGHPVDPAEGAGAHSL